MTSGELAGLRVAQVVCTDAFAGVERYVTTLSRGLAERGCEVIVLGGDGPRMTAELADLPIRWAPAGTPARALRQLLGLPKPDLVHTHMTSAELAAVLARPMVRAPIVTTRHFTKRRGSSAKARVAGRAISGVVAAQLAISAAVARTIEGPSTVVYPGVPSDGTPPDRSREPIVVVAQRLEPEKRTDLALHAWADSGLAEQGWRLVVAGDGAQRADLERLAAQLRVADSCEFRGALPSIGALLRQASMLLATCPVEAFGLSAVEAMAAGLPVVAVKGGGHDETVGLAEGAALFAPDEPAAAGRMLADLAADPVRRESYGAQLREIQQREFTVDRQVEQTLAAYRAVLAERR